MWPNQWRSIEPFRDRIRIGALLPDSQSNLMNAYIHEFMRAPVVKIISLFMAECGAAEDG